MKDYGPGLTFDDLVGLTAFEIDRATLPNDNLSAVIQRASQKLIENELGRFVLMELWGDGHSVWQTSEDGDVVVVTPTGQLSIKQG